MEHHNQEQAKSGRVKRLLRLFRFNVREFLLVAVVLCIGLTWFTRREAWNPEVLRLFSLEQRDDALKKILDEAIYVPNAAYTEKSSGMVVDVIVCPQPSSFPLVTVLVKERPEMAGLHMIVMRSDGTIAPWYRGANMLHNNGELRDLNRDGVIDWIQDWNLRRPVGLVSAINLVPVEEPFTPTLVVYFKPGQFKWRLKDEIPSAKMTTIQLGTGWGGSFKVVAEYVWSKEKEQWIGPRGSAEQGFVLEEDGDTAFALGRLFKE